MDIEIGLQFKNKEGQIGTVIDLTYGEEAELVVWYEKEQKESKYPLSSVNENDLSYFDKKDNVILQTVDSIEFQQLCFPVKKHSKTLVTLVVGLRVYNQYYGFGRIIALYKNYISPVPVFAMQIQYEDQKRCYSLPYNIWRENENNFSHRASFDPEWFLFEPIDDDPCTSMQDGGIYIVSNLAPIETRYSEKLEKDLKKEQNNK